MEYLKVKHLLAIDSSEYAQLMVLLGKLGAEKNNSVAVAALRLALILADECQAKPMSINVTTSSLQATVAGIKPLDPYGPSHVPRADSYYSK